MLLNQYNIITTYVNANYSGKNVRIANSNLYYFSGCAASN